MATVTGATEIHFMGGPRHGSTKSYDKPYRVIRCKDSRGCDAQAVYNVQYPLNSRRPAGVAVWSGSVTPPRHKIVEVFERLMKKNPLKEEK